MRDTSTSEGSRCFVDARELAVDSIFIRVRKLYNVIHTFLTLITCLQFTSELIHPRRRRIVHLVRDRLSLNTTIMGNKRRRRKPKKQTEKTVDEPATNNADAPEEMQLVEEPTNNAKEIKQSANPVKNDNKKEGSDNDEDSVDFAELQGIALSDDSDVEDLLRVVDMSKLQPQTISLAKNDEPAMDRKLADIALFDTATPHGVGKLPFRESLSTPLPLKTTLPDSLATDDIEREKKFAELATEAVHAGLGRLRSLGVKFRRPDDYFAQMIKADDHMTRVKTHLLSERDSIKAAEKRRHDREGLKNRKNESKAQRLAAQERNKKANEEIQAVSKLRKDRVKKRANTAEMNDSDDEFPIHLLEEGVEQLDSESRFTNIRNITSGKKKAWTGGAKGKPFGGPSKGGPSGKKGPQNGIKKKQGSKKRLGKKRRQAAAAKA